MKVIPVINCSDAECIGEKFRKIGMIFDSANVAPEDQWVHIDVADGGFTNGYQTYNANIQMYANDANRIKSGIKIEAHLMVNESEKVIEDWIKAGVKRIIVHAEVIKDFGALKKFCEQNSVELMIALRPETSVESAAQYLKQVNYCQLLAVSPGPAGQGFNPGTIEKIEQLRQQFPQMLIEIDGGINPETARACKEAGADIVASGAYILTSKDPVAAYQELIQI